MAEPQEAIVAILTADPVVAPLVGARIYPLVVPQDVATEAIAYQRVGGPPPELTEDGGGNLSYARIQLSIVAATYSEAQALARAVEKALHGYRGQAGGLLVRLIRKLMEVDSYGQSERQKVVRQDYHVSYRS